ncbi:hypothetical protein BJ912DRAFT_973972, partial [Pholiota molesta]
LGQAGAIDGESFYVTSTYASYPYNDYPTMGPVVTMSFRWNTSQTNVVFNVSADDTSPPPPYLGFDPGQCYGIVITMLPFY